jgi:hypothetical protein
MLDFEVSCVLCVSQTLNIQVVVSHDFDYHICLPYWTAKMLIWSSYFGSEYHGN